MENTIISRFLFSFDQSFDMRVFYFDISKLMFFNEPFTGIGLGNFTLHMQDFTLVKLAPWDYQPVHNAYMLLANEVGVVGSITFILTFILFAIYLIATLNKGSKSRKELGIVLLSVLAALFVIGLFDHYLVSLYHGIMLLFIVFAIVGSFVLIKPSKSH